jgi:hypothetical protein
MNTFKPRSFKVSDLYDWYRQTPSQLSLNPKFQRRSVWSPQSKSYLINTILLGLPLPIFFIRNSTNIQTKKTNREVVDGQQRLRAIFDYIDNGFTLRKVQNEQYGGMYFSQLPDDIQKSFLAYELTVNDLEDITDNQVLDIFARLNSYGVKLNAQELLNAKYFGYFKELAYKIAYNYSKFWDKNKIFTNANIMRMKEVQLVSELLIAMIDGIQGTSVITLDKYYALYDEKFEDRKIIEDRFGETINFIANLYGDNFLNTSYSSSILFYGLFLSVYHENYGLKDLGKPRRKISDKDVSKFRSALDEIESILSSENELSAEEMAFKISCQKSTDHKDKKIVRCSFMISTINRHLGIN